MTTDNRTTEPNDEQVEAAARVLDTKAFRDGEAEARAWAYGGGDYPKAVADQRGRLRTRRYHAHRDARAALVAAAAVTAAHSASLIRSERHSFAVTCSDALTLVDQVIERHGDKIGTHYDDCHLNHVACLAVAVRHRLGGESDE